MHILKVTILTIYYCAAISRIDFDKHTDIILKANKLIKDKNKHIYILEPKIDYMFTN